MIKIPTILSFCLIFLGCNINNKGSNDSNTLWNAPKPEKKAGPLFKLAPAVPSGTECLVPASGIVGWWSGDGNYLDNSGYHHDVNKMNAVGFESSITNEGFNFENSVGSYLMMEEYPDLNPSEQITLEAWVFIRGYSYYPGIISKGNFETLNEAFALYVTQWGSLSMILNSNGSINGRTELIGPIIPTYQWTHVMGTYDGTHMNLYVNGYSVGSKPHGGGINLTNYPLVIGVLEKNNGALSSPSFNGKMDEVTVYNRALNPSEVYSAFNSGIFGKCDPVSIPHVVDIKNSHPLDSLTLSWLKILLEYKSLIGKVNTENYLIDGKLEKKLKRIRKKLKKATNRYKDLEMTLIEIFDFEKSGDNVDLEVIKGKHKSHKKQNLYKRLIKKRKKQTKHFIQWVKKLVKAFTKLNLEGVEQIAQPDAVPSPDPIFVPDPIPQPIPQELPQEPDPAPSI